MPRQSRPWRRKSDGYWYSKINGKLTFLADNEADAWTEFARLRQPQSTDSQITVREVLDRHHLWIAANRAAKTAAWYYDHYHSFGTLMGDELLATELKPHHVTGWLSRQKTWSNSTKFRAAGAIQAAFAWAESEGIIDRHPIRKIKKPEYEPRELYLSPELRNTIREQAGPRFANVLLALEQTGGRIFEIRTVQAANYDRQRGLWVFDRKDSKGKKRPRIIVLSDTMRQLSEKLAGKGYLFTNSRNQPWTSNAVRCQFRRITEAMGLDTQVCATAYRHTFATDFLSSGGDAATLQVLLGHSDLSMIARTYAHLSGNADYLRKEVERINQT